MQNSQVYRGASTYPGPCCTQTNNTPTRTLPLTKQRPHRRNPATPPCPDRVSTKLSCPCCMHTTPWHERPSLSLRPIFVIFSPFFFFSFFLLCGWSGVVEAGGGWRGVSNTRFHNIEQKPSGVFHTRSVNDMWGHWAGFRAWVPLQPRPGEKTGCPCRPEAGHSWYNGIFSSKSPKSLHNNLPLSLYVYIYTHTKQQSITTFQNAFYKQQHTHMENYDAPNIKRSIKINPRCAK